jgi:DNA-binding LacI/PurR family transcriptional regulator
MTTNHESITHVDGRRAPDAAERRRGYRAAMRGLGLESRMRLMPGGLTEQDGEQAALQLAAGSPPTAITAFNDHCAAGLLTAVRSRGIRVPDELSLVGYDDSHIASLPSIALTTIAQDAATLASTALDLALARADDPDREPSDVAVPPRLVVRRTSGAPVSRRTGRTSRS